MFKHSRALHAVILVGLLSFHATCHADESADQNAIEESAKQYVDAFNRRDAVAISKLFGDDGELVESDGTRFSGREEIVAAYQEVFEQSPDAKLSLSVTSVRFVTADVAVEEGVTTFYPDGITATVESKYRAAHVQRDGQWMIAAVRAIENEILTPFEHLRELQWMVGDWLDESREYLVVNQVRWAPNRAFLLREFTIKRGGDDLLKGTQRIGWDAASKSFRSWTFDSEGGFVEGTWTRVGDGFVVRSAGVLQDGTNVSGTTRMDRLSDDRCRWFMFDRLRGAEIVPDAKIVMVRKPPAPSTK